MIRPPRGDCRFMRRKACWVHRNAPVRFVSTTVRHCSTVSSSSGTPGAPTPALLNNRSRRPKRSATSSNSASTDAGSVTSPTMATAPRPPGRRSPPTGRGGGRRATTVNPASASATAAARPMPLPAPVTTRSRSSRWLRETAAELVVDVDARRCRRSALGDETRASTLDGCRTAAGQPATMRAIVSSGSRRTRRSASAPPKRRSEASCSATVADTPGIVRQRRCRARRCRASPHGGRSRSPRVARRTSGERRRTPAAPPRGR